MILNFCILLSMCVKTDLTIYIKLSNVKCQWTPWWCSLIWWWTLCKCPWWTLSTCKWWWVKWECLKCKPWTLWWWAEWCHKACVIQVIETCTDRNKLDLNNRDNLDNNNSNNKHLRKGLGMLIHWRRDWVSLWRLIKRKRESCWGNCYSLRFRLVWKGMMTMRPRLQGCW